MSYRFRIAAGLICALALALAIPALRPHPAAAQTAAVTIQNFSFMPATMTVAAGTTVTWTNRDNAAHTATSDTGVWDSGALTTGKPFSYTFNTPGTYPYHCSFHQYMKGTIVVQAATTTGATATALPATAAPSATPQPSATSVPLAAYPVSRHAMAVKRVAAQNVNGQYRFVPAKITVHVGTKVIWTNPSDAPHTVTFDTGATFNKVLPQGKTVHFVFKKAGTYKYHCQYHPGMAGIVVVKP